MIGAERMDHVAIKNVLEAIRKRVERAHQTVESPPLCISDREFLLRMFDAANDRNAELEATLEQVHGALGSVLADVTKLTQLFGRKTEGP